MAKNRKKILFLGFYVSKKSMDTIVVKDKYPSIQTHKYSLGLLKALSDKFKVEVVSVAPVSDYPVYSDMFVKGKKYNEMFSKSIVKVVEVGFINRGLLKLLTRFILVKFEILKQIVRCKPDFLIVYSVHVPFMVLGLIFSRMFRVKLIGVWTDPPSVGHVSDSALKRALRGVELKISLFLMKRFTGAIVLSKYLAIDFMPNKPYLVVESILNDPIEENKNNISKGKKKIVYAGSVNEKYGVPEILTAIENMSRDDFEFHIYGSGDYEQHVEEFSKADSRVIFHGFVKQECIKNALNEADFLINIRSEVDSFVKYSFPSKITEYMASGTPVIATMLPGIPSEYQNYIINVRNNSTDELILKLNESLDMYREDACYLGSHAKAYIIKKSWQYQSCRIQSFLSEIKCNC